MSGPIVAFAADATVDRPKRAERLQDALHDASNAVDKALHLAGLLPSPHISPGAACEHMPGVHGLRCREWHAQWALIGFWERQASKYRTILRRAFACDGVDDEARQAILKGVYGGGTDARRRREMNALSDAERRLLDEYRRLDDTARQMIRTLFARLAVSTVADDDGGTQ